MDADCPHCASPNVYRIETGSDLLESVHGTREETDWTEKNIAFSVMDLKCGHCGKEFYAVLLDQRW
jgi:hypothetical protein